MRPVLFGIVVVFLLHSVVSAQSTRAERSGRRALLPRAEEIALARSAAPASVSDAASIYVLTDSGFVLAVRGSSDAACYVSRSWSLSIEPHCFDAEGAATLMRMEMQTVELLHAGVSHDSAQRRVNADLAEGRLRLPRRPAMSYMMSAAQVLYNDTGNRVGAWQPHLMIYYPFLRTAELGMRTPDIAAAIVTDEGTAKSSIMIVVKEAVKVRPETAAR